MEAPASSLSATLERDGFAYGRGAALAASCERLRAHADEALARVLDLDLDAQHDLFGEIRTPLYRRDLKLSLAPAVTQVLCEVAQALGESLQAAVGAAANLCELSVISSDPGAEAQPTHCDTSYQGAAADVAIGRLVSVFVALQDITAEMGPTQVWPRTHGREEHSLLSLQPKSDFPAVLRDRPTELALLRTGDALLMDSRLWHRGGANKSRSRRSLLVLSFVSSEGGRPAGSTYSLLSGLPTLDLARLRSGALTTPPPHPTLCLAGRVGAPARARSVVLPLRAAVPLLDLAERGLPEEEPVAQRCVRTLREAVGAAGASAVLVPAALIHHLASFRLLGPHLRASSRWRSMHADIEAAIAAAAAEEEGEEEEETGPPTPPPSSSPPRPPSPRS